MCLSPPPLLLLCGLSNHCGHQNKRLLLLALVVLAVRAWPKLRWLLRLAHYKLTAEVPQLVYRKTAQNERLLERCETLSACVCVCVGGVMKREDGGGGRKRLVDGHSW